MKPKFHAVATGLGAGLLVLLFGSWPAAAASCFTGIFIDLDHVGDYFFARRRIPGASDFIEFWATFKEPRLYIYFHAWEFNFLWLIFAALGWAKPIMLGLAFGMLHHLVLDQIGNGVTVGAYWLSWRIAVGFQSRYLLKCMQNQPEGSTQTHSA